MVRYFIIIGIAKVQYCGFNFTGLCVNSESKVSGILSAFFKKTVPLNNIYTIEVIITSIRVYEADMEINVGNLVADLLYEHNSIAVPALGSFVSEYKAAGIDHVQGKVQPPSLQITFQPHLMLDDGLLVEKVKTEHHLNLESARREVEAYANSIRSSLDRGEIVNIPQVGRLYLDYEKQLRFLQEGNNFNAEAFGLPVVSFLPVRRSEAAATTLSGNAKSAQTPAQTPAAIAQWFQRHIAWLGALTFMLVAAGLYIVFFMPQNKSAGNTNQDNGISVPTERINISPTSQPLSDDPENTVSNNEGETDGGDTEEATLPPDQQSCIILIGKFGNESNIKRLIQRIYDAGYEPYTEKAGELTLVGIQFVYDTDKEVQRTLSAVRKKFDKRARVMKR